VALANKPNPASGATDIQFSLVADERIELSIYDLSGRSVRSLAKGTFSAGPNTVHWDGLDANGHPVAPGIYMARLKGTHTQATHNVVWMN
jgi:flagellar hook assembly protein FlgD